MFSYVAGQDDSMVWASKASHSLPCILKTTRRFFSTPQLHASVDQIANTIRLCLNLSFSPYVPAADGHWADELPTNTALS
jgi:hypothetical protein